jgi:hypothetical protein
MHITLTRFALLFLSCVFLYSPRPTFAQHSEEFSLPANKAADAITGVIEWPHGPLRQWNGPIVILIPPAGPFTRDGWQAPAHLGQTQNNSPFTGLSAALRKEGIAVVRFEHPAARDPRRRCREALERGEISEFTLRTKCIDYRLIEKLTVARYRAALASMLSHIQRQIPVARKKMALFGFSEGLIHSAAIADYTSIPIAALVSIGSPAERVSSAVRWQIVGRPLEWLPQFDLDANGIITNEEIQRGYKQGVGNIMSLRLWISPEGHWDERNIDQLKSRLENTYTEILGEFGDDKELGRLHWRFLNDSIRAPYATDSFLYHVLNDTLSTIEIMERHKISGLFLWGETDTQVSMARQLPLIEAANGRGANIQFLQYPERSHLLSRHPDEIWFEPEFAPTIAHRVRQFLDDALAVPKYAHRTKAPPASGHVFSKSAVTRQHTTIPPGVGFQPAKGDSNYARNVER